MEEVINVHSWLLKPCSDGISIDVRPPDRFQIDLLSLKNQQIDDFILKIVSSSIVILYTEKNNIKITLYQSGRMLIETREMDTAENIVQSLLKSLKLV